MTYQFTDTEIAEIQALRGGQGTAVDTYGVPFNNSARPVSGVYRYILSLISKNNDPSLGPAGGIDRAVWQWFRAATDVNLGQGVFSVFIRTYTAEQRRLRIGSPTTKQEMDAASDSIGDRIIASILSNKQLVKLIEIGEHDAGAIGDNVFSGTANPLAGWSGNVLFPVLGISKFFRENIVSDAQDAYDFLALMHSTQVALSAALGQSVTDIVKGLRTLWSVSFGDESTLNLSNLASDLMKAREFFIERYGEELITPTFALGSVGASVYFTLANSYLTNDIQLGREGDKSERFEATGRDNIIFAGGGDDYIKASDASLLENPLLDSDLIDGGSGIDTVDYEIADSITVKFDTRTTRELFIATVGKDWTPAEDLLFNIEKIIGSKKNDSFSGSMDHVSAEFVIDGSVGDDEIDIKANHSITVIGGIGRDWINAQANGGVIYGDTIDGIDPITGERVADNAANSDNIWFAANTVVMDAQHHDFLKYYGLTLTGGNAEGGIAGLSIFGGVGGAVGMANFWNSLDENGKYDPARSIYYDHLFPWMTYAFRPNADGGLDMYVTNKFDGLFTAVFGDGASEAYRAHQQ